MQTITPLPRRSRSGGRVSHLPDRSRFARHVIGRISIGTFIGPGSADLTMDGTRNGLFIFAAVSYAMFTRLTVVLLRKT